MAQNTSFFNVAPYILIRKLIRSLYYKKTSFSHRGLTSNQYRDTFWMQNELMVDKLHCRTACCGHLKKYGAVTVTNHENSQKPHLFDETSKINLFLLTSSKRWTFFLHVLKFFEMILSPLCECILLCCTEYKSHRLKMRYLISLVLSRNLL